MMVFTSVPPREKTRVPLAVVKLTEQLSVFNPPELFILDAGKASTLVTARGSRLTFPAFAWQSPDGKIISGDVSLSVEELISQSDIALAGLGTTAQDRLLEMPVILKLSASAAQSALALRLPVEWEIPLDRHEHINPLSQRLYHAAQPSLQVCGTHAKYDWQLAHTPKLKFRSLFKRQHLVFQLPQLGCWGAGAPVKCRHSRKMVSVKTIAPVPNFQEQKAFVLFEKKNAVMSMYEGSRHFTSFHVPACDPATIIVYGVYEERFFFGTTKLHPRNCLETVSMEEIQLTVFLKKLEELIH